MRLHLLRLMIIGLLATAAEYVCAAGNAQEPAVAKLSAKPEDPSFVPVPDDPKLPRVLILGDSISMGYTIPVRQLLKGKANVHRPSANCGDTAAGLKDLDKWLATDSPSGQKWDVIVFNFGLHDLKFLDPKGKYVNPPDGKQVASPEQYGKNLQEFADRLKKTGAKLIFASTTPVPEGTTGRVAGDEVPFNTAAKKVMAKNGVAVDDLCAVAETDLKVYQRPHNVHFTDKGYKALAKSVAESIKTALKE